MRASILYGVIFTGLFSFASSDVFAKDSPQEMTFLRDRFLSEVGGIRLDDKYTPVLVQKATELLHGNQLERLETSQFFLLIDRNPNAQTASLAFFDAEATAVAIVGSTKTSTGNPKRVGHYETPVGIFKNSPVNMSYRALGTKNDKGWR